MECLSYLSNLRIFSLVGTLAGGQIHNVIIIRYTSVHVCKLMWKGASSVGEAQQIEYARWPEMTPK